MAPLDRAAQVLAERMADDLDAHGAPFYRDAVRAVLAALAEPSPGMVEAGEESIDDCVVTHTVAKAQAVRDVWTAMLAAAREGA